MEYKVNINLGFTINRCVYTIRLLLNAEQPIKGRGRFPDLELGSQSGIGLWSGKKPQPVRSARIGTGLPANNKAFSRSVQVSCCY